MTPCEQHGPDKHAYLAYGFAIMHNADNPRHQKEEHNMCCLHLGQMHT